MVMFLISLWIIPMIMIGYITYLSMESGESVEDFVWKNDLEDIWWVTFIPMVNIILLGYIIMSMICKYVKNLKKK